MISTTEWLLRN